MNNKPPAFQWYPKDILSSKRVAMMTLAEEGAYRRAIDFCWLHGSLPADVRQLAMLIGKDCTKKIAEKVKDMFVEENGELRHDRLDSERRKQEDWRVKSILAGKRSAEKRAAKSQPTANQTSTKVEPPLQNGSNQNPTLQSPVSNLQSSSPKSTVQNPAGGDEKKLNAKQETKIDLPWPSILFAEMWEKWKKFRAAEKRVKFKSAESELAQLKRLHTLAFGDEQTAIQIIEQSIGNQWLGLFQLPANNQLKNTENGTGNNNSKTPLWRR